MLIFRLLTIQPWGVLEWILLSITSNGGGESKKMGHAILVRRVAKTPKSLMAHTKAIATEELYQTCKMQNIEAPKVGWTVDGFPIYLTLATRHLSSPRPKERALDLGDAFVDRCGDNLRHKVVDDLRGDV